MPEPKRPVSAGVDSAAETSPDAFRRVEGSSPVDGAEDEGASRSQPARPLVPSTTMRPSAPSATSARAPGFSTCDARGRDFAHGRGRLSSRHPLHPGVGSHLDGHHRLLSSRRGERSREASCQPDAGNHHRLHRHVRRPRAGGASLFSPMFGLNSQIASLLESIPRYVNDVVVWFTDVYNKYAPMFEDETVKQLLADVQGSLASWRRASRRKRQRFVHGGHRRRERGDGHRLRLWSSRSGF